MFGIDARPGEARSEPFLRLRPEVAPGQRLSLGAPLPLDGDRPVGSQERRRPYGPVVSLILHLLPVLLLIHWPTPPPTEVTPIPVRLVFQPPPPPPPQPAPKPQPKREVRPPPGRIASENLGETRTKGRDDAKSDAPAPKRQPAGPAGPALEAPQQTAFLPPPPRLADPPKLELPTPPRKPAPAASRPIRREPQRGRLDPRPARYPGPAATRDEYLAYLAYLARQHIGMLRGVIDGRRGETIVNVLVLDDGTVAMLSVGLSSGYPDIDERVEAMIRAVGRFPPLPQWYQEPAMRLEFRLRFPEALED